MKYTNEYREKEYQTKIELVKLLNSFDSGYTFELIEDDTNDSREKVMLKGIVPITVNYNEYEKKYHFFLDYTLPYVRYNAYNAVSEKYPDLNTVGVLHKNKIKAWIDRLITIYEELVIISTERQAKVTAFLETMKENNASIEKMDEHYKTTSGYIIKNGIEYKFQVHDEGYISQDIEIHYKVKDSLESFLQLSSNEYKEVE